MTNPRQRLLKKAVAVRDESCYSISSVSDDWCKDIGQTCAETYPDHCAKDGSGTKAPTDANSGASSAPSSNSGSITSTPSSSCGEVSRSLSQEIITGMVDVEMVQIEFPVSSSTVSLQTAQGGSYSIEIRMGNARYSTSYTHEVLNIKKKLVIKMKNSFLETTGSYADRDHASLSLLAGLLALSGTRSPLATAAFSLPLVAMCYGDDCGDVSISVVLTVPTDIDTSLMSNTFVSNGPSTLVFFLLNSDRTSTTATPTSLSGTTATPTSFTSTTATPTSFTSTTATPTPPTTITPAPSFGASASTADKVKQILSSKHSYVNANVFLYETPTSQWLPSTMYKSEDFLTAADLMHATGAGSFKLYFGVDSEGDNAYKYGLVNLAAFLAQAKQETIRYNVCDENNWDNYSSDGKAAISNSCGQLSQSYQDYTCSAEEAHMQCDVDLSMEITASTNAQWWGAPPPLRCGPKIKYPTTGYWNPNLSCPAGGCNSYAGQVGGQEIETTTANQAGRTDIEGCCWWGRGVIQTTGICNFGKMNYFLGKKASEDGRPSAYPDVDFCKTPDKICSDATKPELKWIAGLFYWISSVQTFATEEFNYLESLHAFMDAGVFTDAASFIDKVSGIVNRGCPRSTCDTGAVHALSERRQNFVDILTAFGIM